MTTGQTLAIDRQRVQRSAPSRPKTASGGLRTVPHNRLSRWRLQGADASGKMRPSYDPVRRVPHLPQSDGKKPDFCRNGLYKLLDDIDNGAGYGQLVALGGGLMGQAEPYPVVRAAFRAGALKGYAALGAVRDVATVGKFFLGDRTTVSDLIKSLAVKGLGLDKANEVLADTFGALVDEARGQEGPC